MPVPIEINAEVGYIMMRNCITNNIVNAQNQTTGRIEPLQYNWWGMATPFTTPGSLPPGVSVDWYASELRILGDILWIPTMNIPCNEERPNPVTNQFPSSIRIGTMMNRRNILGGWRGGK